MPIHQELIIAMTFFILGVFIIVFLSMFLYFLGERERKKRQRGKGEGDRWRERMYVWEVEDNLLIYRTMRRHIWTGEDNCSSLECSELWCGWFLDGLWMVFLRESLIWRKWWLKGWTIWKKNGSLHLNRVPSSIMWSCHWNVVSQLAVKVHQFHGSLFRSGFLTL